MNRVVLHIDRLVLRGIDAGQRDVLVAALRDELAQALSQSGAAEAWAASGHRARLSARVGPTQPAAATAADLGRACAQAIARGENR